MRLKWIALLSLVATGVGGGLALASHVPQLDPAQVPIGFFATHNAIHDFPVSPLARAAAHGGSDVFVQHVRLDPGVATPWHTHPGPAIVTIVRGSLTYEAAAESGRGQLAAPEGARGNCRRTPYAAGAGFVDRGFGHVHRVIAGAEGVDFYVTYVLPPGSATHVISAPAPAECTP